MRVRETGGVSLWREAAPRLLSSPRINNEHYFAVDLLRGFAALAVVIFHYLNFFVPAGREEVVPDYRQLEPFYHLLWPAYEYGLWAVQLFWLISGFVFAGVYIGRSTSTRSFVTARFARLYPLHFITLLVVAALQFLRLDRLGNFQTYLFNDAYHFVLNLFMASNWGLERGSSFNAPIWSVSVEIAIYVVFWLTLPRLYRLGALGPLALAGFFTIGSIFTLPGTVFWQCGFYFFCGSSIYVVFSVLRSRPWLFFAAGALAILAASAVVLRTHLAVGHLMPIILPGIFLLACGVEASGWIRGSRWTTWIGENTYGVYLWHIPVQLVLLLVLDGLVGSRHAATHLWFLVLFLGFVVGLARLTFLTIEGPARDAIRRWGARHPAAPHLYVVRAEPVP